MNRTIPMFLGAEILIFGTAALAHSGVFGPGAAHHQAAIAEAVIAGDVQALALLGTLLGAVMIAIGIGPQSFGDLLVHALMLLVLVVGLVQVWRRPRTSPTSASPTSRRSASRPMPRAR